MATSNHQECSITYKTGAIILRGKDTAIHQQAVIILRRFELSSVQYHITRDSGQEIVLSADI